MMGAVYAKVYLRDSEPIKTTTGQITAAALLSLPLTGYFNAGEVVGISTAVSVITLAVVCTAIGYTLYFRLIANVGASNASLVTMLVPVFSLLWSLIFLDEPVTSALLIGLAMPQN